MISMNKNFYYANVGLIECKNCAGEAIISIEGAKRLKVAQLICPYCGGRNVEIVVETTDEDRAEFHFDKFTLCERK